MWIILQVLDFPIHFRRSSTETVVSKINTWLNKDIPRASVSGELSWQPALITKWFSEKEVFFCGAKLYCNAKRRNMYLKTFMVNSNGNFVRIEQIMTLSIFLVLVCHIISHMTNYFIDLNHYSSFGFAIAQRAIYWLCYLELTFLPLNILHFQLRHLNRV